jgi:excisionase family DNA binding protein
MDDQATPLMVSPKQAGEMLGLCRATVYMLMNTGVLKSTKYGSARRITVESIKRAATGRTGARRAPKRQLASSPDLEAAPALAASEG